MQLGQLTRREVIAVLNGAALWPLTSIAEQRKVPTIGILVVGAPGSEQFRRLFQNDMAELGYVGGQNIRYEFRSDEGQIGRLPELAAELVRLNVDLIVTWFTPAAKAAKEATREIPIVIALAGDPVANGLVVSSQSARRQRHGHVRGKRGTQWQKRGTDSRYVAVRASSGGAG